MQAASVKNMDVGDLIKNPKVQIGIIVAAVVIIGIIVAVMFLGNRSSSSGDTGNMTNPAAQSNLPGDGGPGAGPNGPGTGGLDANGPGGGDMAGANGPLGDPNAAMGGGEAAPAADDKSIKKGGPIQPARKNPFQPNSDMEAVFKSIPEYVEPNQTPQHYVYQELNPVRPDKGVSQSDPLEGPPIPAMRVAGVVMGSQVSALLQMGSENIQVTPGKMIPDQNPVYRVERIEADKVILTRRWQIGDRKGTQRIEVRLQGDPNAAPYPTYTPGQTGGFGGFSGGFSGRGGRPGGGNGPGGS